MTGTLTAAFIVPLVLFFAVVGFSGHQHPPPVAPTRTAMARVQELSARDVYDAFSEPGNTILVCSKNCRACHEMLPEIKKASAMTGKTLYRFCGDGNDEIVQKLHSSYGLTAYPTLYRTQNDSARISVYPPEGPRNAADIADFMDRGALETTGVSEKP